MRSVPDQEDATPRSTPPPFFIQSLRESRGRRNTDGDADSPVNSERVKFLHVDEVNFQSHDNTSAEEDEYDEDIPYEASPILNAVTNSLVKESVDDLIKKLLPPRSGTPFKPKVVNLVEMGEVKQNNINIIQHANKVYICKDGICIHEKCPKTSGYDEKTNTKITFLPNKAPTASGVTSATPLNNSSSQVILNSATSLDDPIMPVNYSNYFQQHYFPDYKYQKEKENRFVKLKMLVFRPLCFCHHHPTFIVDYRYLKIFREK